MITCEKALNSHFSEKDTAITIKKRKKLSCNYNKMNNSRKRENVIALCNVNSEKISAYIKASLKYMEIRTFFNNGACCHIRS